jgi:hypothetical protein
MLPSSDWGAPASAGGTAPTACKADRPRPGGAAPPKEPGFPRTGLVTPSEADTGVRTRGMWEVLCLTR